MGFITMGDRIWQIWGHTDFPSIFSAKAWECHGTGTSLGDPIEAVGDVMVGGLHWNQPCTRLLGTCLSPCPIEVGWWLEVPHDFEIFRKPPNWWMTHCSAQIQHFKVREETLKVERHHDLSMDQVFTTTLNWRLGLGLKLSAFSTEFY